jgi:predicted  nucleic acid-binding Zn-ribbon protein
MLIRNQLLLRLASVDLLDGDGQEIEFAIKRVLSVTISKVNNGKFSGAAQGGRFPSASPGVAELQQLKIDLHNQREDIKRIDSNGFRIVSALDKRAARVEGEVAGLKVTVPGLRRDIGSLQRELGSIKTEMTQLRESAGKMAAMSRLEDRLTSVTNHLGEVEYQLETMDTQFQKELGKLRSELNRQQQDIDNLRSETRRCVAVQDHAQDMAALRAEMAQLRREMDETRSRGAGQAETAFPSRKLDVLTSNIAKLGSRASQVETLQMELEILRGRVERVEASRQANDRLPARPIDPASLPGYSDIFPAVRKRAASPGDEPAPKRSASSLGYPDLADRRYANPSAWSLPSPVDCEGGPENDGTSHIPNSAGRGRKASRGGTSGTSNGVSARLRKQ